MRRAVVPRPVKRYDRNGRLVPNGPKANNSNRNRFALLPVDVGGIYSPLSTDSQEIRLLCVSPAQSWSCALVCTLRTVSLLDQPNYKALSYVWGDKEDVLNIRLEDEEVSVTSHLAFALKRVRQSEDSLLIWVDALCIYLDRPRAKHCRNLRFPPRTFLPGHFSQDISPRTFLLEAQFS